MSRTKITAGFLNTGAVSANSNIGENVVTEHNIKNGNITTEKLGAGSVTTAKVASGITLTPSKVNATGPVTAPIVTANTLASTTLTATNANFTTLQADVIDFDGDVTVDTVTANSVNATTANFTSLQADSIDFDGDMTVDKVTANTIHSLVKITANNIGTNILTTQGPITAPKVTANSFGKIVTSNIITTPAVIANTFQSHTSKIADGNAVNGSVNIAEASNDAGIVMSIFGNNTNYTRISGQKSRNASVGSHTVIQDGDGILEIGAFGSDGTDYHHSGKIRFEVDGSPGNNDIPGRIVFLTTPDGGITPQEAVRISQDKSTLFSGLVTITTADNLVQLTLKSTDSDANNGPILDLVRDSGSPANNDEIGVIRFKFDDDAGEVNTAVQFQAKIEDASNGAEDGSLEITTLIGGSSRSRIELQATETVFNEDSLDVNFRVESNGNANMFFVDAGNDKVGVGTNTPAARLSALSTSGTTTDIGRFEAAVGSYTGTSLVAGNTLGAASTYNLFKCITDSDADAGGPDTQFLVRGDGNVMIGTTTGSEKLRIVNNSDTDFAPGSSAFNTLLMLKNGTAGALNPASLAFATETNGEIYLSAVENSDNDAADLRFTLRDSGNRYERFRFMSNGRLENQSPTNSGNVLQDFRIDWRNENNAGIMAGIGVVRTADGNAPGAFVIRTSTNVDSSSNNGDGEISEKFRVAANGDLTATDTSIASNSDSRLKTNIADYDYDLEKFKLFEPKTFDWKQPSLHGDKTGQRGFIAQDLEAVDNYWVDRVEVPSDSEDFQYLEDEDIYYTENSKSIPEGKKVGDLYYKARFAKTGKLGQKDAMYISVIKQLISKIETLETKVATLEGE